MICHAGAFSSRESERATRNRLLHTRNCVTMDPYTCCDRGGWSMGLLLDPSRSSKFHHSRQKLCNVFEQSVLLHMGRSGISTSQLQGTDLLLVTDAEIRSVSLSKKLRGRHSYESDRRDEVGRDLNEPSTTAFRKHHLEYVWPNHPLVNLGTGKSGHHLTRLRD